MNKHYLLLMGIGLLVGGVAGYVYYAQVGCVKGTCAIWAHPWRSTGYGALLGTLLASLLADFKKVA